MATTNATISYKYIDEICPNTSHAPHCLYTNKEEVLNIITGLNPSKAYDVYDVSTSKIKQLKQSTEFIESITSLWNNIIDNEEIPQDMKIDRIIYLWKRKGCKLDAKYYRPITLVTATSKITEGILHHKIQMIVPMPADKIQHAYKQNRSIQTGLLELDDCLLKHGNYHRDISYPYVNHPSAVIILDLKGALESVDHFSLTHFFGKFSPILAKVTKYYLTNRIANIFNRNFTEENPQLKYTPSRSVPQGSKVSPILFSMTQY